MTVCKKLGPLRITGAWRGGSRWLTLALGEYAYLSADFGPIEYGFGAGVSTTNETLLF